MMRICGNCEYNDGVVYTSFPPMLKCTITKEFHRNDHVCKLEFVPVVRCKDCKHRIVNEHFGEKGYMKLKAMCTLDTGDPFELGRDAYDDNWYCADGERKDNNV